MGLYAVECKPDKVLIEEVLGASAYCMSGKGEVVKAIEKGRFGRGLIDEDPFSTQPKSLASYKIVRVQEGVIKRRKGSSVLLSLSPRLEEWIIEACRQVGIDLRMFGLPQDPKKLHRKINYNLDRFRRLVRELIKLNSPRIVVLRNLAGDC